MDYKFDPNILNHPYKPLRKIAVVWNGFWFVFKNDPSVTYKVIISVIFLILALFMRNSVDVILILVATGVMLAMEMMNSCVELMCDFLETGYNEKIKLIKDVAATATGVTILVWALILGYEIFSLFT